MSDTENTNQVNTQPAVAATPVAAAQAAVPGIDKRGGRTDRSRRPRRNDSRKQENDGFDTKIILIRRVSRSYKGGKRLRISVCAAVGDRKGSVGIGIGKGTDVRDAQSKAVTMAKKNLIVVKLKGNTIPHNATSKVGAAQLLLRPASPGTGVIAGSSVRVVLELAGVKDILSKVMGSRNQINNAYATITALKSMRLEKL
jgi:small subunit ribosomal protein S5